MNRQEMKHRVRLCLALYLLFAFIPALHGALHPGLLPTADLVGTAAPPEITTACPDGCENPEHRHLTRSHDCPVCKTGWNPHAIPQPQNRGLPVTCGGSDLAQVGGFFLGTSHIRIENARAPPEPLLL